MGQPHWALALPPQHNNKLLSFSLQERKKKKKKFTERKKMEEMMMMIRDLNQIMSSDSEQPTTFTTWKLYDNPFFISSSHQQKTHHFHHHHHLHQQQSSIPLSARKIAASLWDFSFFQSIMSSQLELAKTQIRELKAEVEFERKLRKKVESLNKKLGKELSEQRKSRESIECLCEELAKEIASDRAEISRMRREIEEERKMLRMSEVLREERVQMKFAEAKVLFEEKMLELEFVKEVEIQTLKSEFEEKRDDEKRMGISRIESGNLGSFENSDLNSNGVGVGVGVGVRSSSTSSSVVSQRRASPEAENPHIKRGIKGFVEFPRVVRAIGSRGRQLGSKLECQKAQLRLLLRQKSPFRSTNVNLIMG